MISYKGEPAVAAPKRLYQTIYPVNDLASVFKNSRDIISQFFVTFYDPIKRPFSIKYL